MITCGALKCVNYNYRLLCEAAFPLPVTFHRAFDVCTQPLLSSLRDIQQSGCSTLLTSGRAQTAGGGIQTLGEIQKMLKEEKINLTLMVGAGVNSRNIKELMDDSNAKWLHGSFSLKHSFKNDIFDLGIKFTTAEDEVRKAVKSVQ